MTDGPAKPKGGAMRCWGHNEEVRQIRPIILNLTTAIVPRNLRLHYASLKRHHQRSHLHARIDRMHPPDDASIMCRKPPQSAKPDGSAMPRGGQNEEAEARQIQPILNLTMTHPSSLESMCPLCLSKKTLSLATKSSLPLPSLPFPSSIFFHQTRTYTLKMVEAAQHRTSVFFSYRLDRRSRQNR